MILDETPGNRDTRTPAIAVASSPAAAAGLTPRQLQVIRRVAEGRTNREIAAELYLSVRTVDMHVRNSHIALGCRSRMDAARKAGELGLLERV